MKRLLLILLLLSTPAYAYKITPSVGYGLDQVGVQASSDVSIKGANNADVIQWSSAQSAWIVGAQTSSGGGGSGTTITVSKNGVLVASADTVNFTTGFGVTNSGSKVTVSDSIATVTTPGIASFDNAYFTVAPLGGVSLTSGLTASINSVIAVSHAAVTVTGENYLTLSGQAITANSVTLSGTNVTGTLTVNKGGTGISSISANAVLIGHVGGGSYDQPAVPSCADSGGNHLNFSTATNTWTCGTSSGAGTTLVASNNIAIVTAGSTSSIGFSNNVVMVSSFVDKVVTLTDASTIATNAALGNHFIVTLGASRTLGNPTNPTNGQKVVWMVSQDATGSRTLAYGNAFRFSTDIPSPTLSTASGTIDYIGAIYNANGSNVSWDVVAVTKGFKTS